MPKMKSNIEPNVKIGGNLINKGRIVINKEIEEPALYKACEYLTSKKGKKAILEAIKLAEKEVCEWTKFKKKAEKMAHRKFTDAQKVS